MHKPISYRRHHARLPRRYDPDALLQDLIRLQHIEALPQPGHYHDGGWRGVALYSQGGRQSSMPTRAGLERYAPTFALEIAPTMRALLDDLDCPKMVVRLLTLAPGGVIKTHCDPDVGFKAGMLRLHAPIVTDPGVEFTLGGERQHWASGELWYGDFAQPHAVVNRSGVTRVHLVADVEITPALLDLFPADFTAAQDVTYAAELISMPAVEMSHYACNFALSAALAPLFCGTLPLRAVRNGVTVQVSAIDGELLGIIADAPRFALDPVGEGRFRVRGLASNTTLYIDLAGKTAAAVRLEVRGLPEDLYAAALGLPAGPPIGARIEDCRILAPAHRA